MAFNVGYTEQLIVVWSDKVAFGCQIWTIRTSQCAFAACLSPLRLGSIRRQSFKGCTAMGWSFIQQQIHGKPRKMPTKWRTLLIGEENDATTLGRRYNASSC